MDVKRPTQHVPGPGGSAGAASESSTKSTVVQRVHRTEGALWGGGGGVEEVPTGRATRVRRLRHDRMEQGPTEPHAGRSTFLLSSGGAEGRVLLSGR